MSLVRIICSFAPRSCWHEVVSELHLNLLPLYSIHLLLESTSQGIVNQQRVCLVQDKTEGGKIIRVEAHPIPEHPRPHRCKGRVTLVGDAAGYVTKCSGEGIYFAAKSGRMAAEAIVEGSQQVSPQPAVRCMLQLQ